MNELPIAIPSVSDDYRRESMEDIRRLVTRRADLRNTLRAVADGKLTISATGVARREVPTKRDCVGYGQPCTAALSKLEGLGLVAIASDRAEMTDAGRAMLEGGAA
jgi:hypothetical protein